MPHTSRRKKHAPVKRLEVTDDDGWTRVTTTNRERRGPRAIGSPISSESFWKTTPDKGASAEKIRQEYERSQEQWKASDSCRVLVSLLQEKILPENVEIDRCLIFGSGSFCGLRQGWISRKHSALCQIAVMKSIQSTIEETTTKTVPIYAQDPAYNDVDVSFLHNFGANVAETPTGFDLVTDKSLVYAPNAEYHVEMQVLKKKPAVLLTSRLSWMWRNEKGQACTDRTPVQVESASEDLHQYDACMVREELEQDCQSLEDFLHVKQEAQIPSLDSRDNPFDNQHLYWPKPREDGEKGQTQDVVE